MKNKILLAVVVLLVVIIGVLAFFLFGNKKEEEKVLIQTENLEQTPALPIVSEPEEGFSEQPNQAKFNEYFTNAWMGKLSQGQQFDPQKVVKTKVFLATDQMCISMDMKKDIAAEQLSTAFYDKSAGNYIRPKSDFPQKLTSGNMVGCESIDFPAGEYEQKIYVDDVLAIILPFEIK